MAARWWIFGLWGAMVVWWRELWRGHVECGEPHCHHTSSSDQQQNTRLFFILGKMASGQEKRSELDAKA
ncbi:hypothetical protein Tco_1380645, partial [Tanacetum coccineum]